MTDTITSRSAFRRHQLQVAAAFAKTREEAQAILAEVAAIDALGALANETRGL